MYRLEFSPAADRDLQRLKERTREEDFERLRDAIHGLTHEPRPYGVRKIKDAERAFRIRVGGYRVIYEVYDNDNLVVILHISRRNESTYR